MRVTIKDVAKHAGVSISTVSRVLNGKGIVTPEKEKRVLKAAEELQFTPSAIAQSLKSQKTQKIGLLVSDFAITFFPGILRVLENGLESHGFRIISGNFRDDPQTELHLIEDMVRDRVDALLVNVGNSNIDRLCEIQASGIPVLSFDRHPENREFPSVYVDKAKGVYDLLVYMYRLGHRRLCFLSGPAELSTNKDRLAGVRRFESDYPDARVLVRFGSFSEDFGYQAFQETAFGEDAPTGYITGSIAITAGIMQLCGMRGIRIPEDISLASFGTFQYASLITPTLVHVDDEYTLIAQQLLDWLRQILVEDKPLPHNRERVIPARLIMGDSCAPPRQGLLVPKG